MASATRRSEPSCCGGEATERAGQRGQRDRERGCAAAVDGDPLRTLAGQLADRVPGGQLDRVRRVTVVVETPAVAYGSGEHSGVLAGTVHRDPGLVADRADVRHPRIVVDRPVRRGLQGVLAQPGAGEDPTAPVDVDLLAGVRRGDQRQQIVRQVQPRVDHRYRLERLQRAPRIDRGVHGADADQQLTVGPGDRHPGAVHALGQPVADHLDHDRIVGERIGHGQRL